MIFHGYVTNNQMVYIYIFSSCRIQINPDDRIQLMFSGLIGWPFLATISSPVRLRHQFLFDPRPSDVGNMTWLALLDIGNPLTLQDGCDDTDHLCYFVAPRFMSETHFYLRVMSLCIVESMYIFINTYIYIHAFIHMYIHTHRYINTHIDICICLYVYVYVYKCIHVYMCICVFVYMCKCVYV